MRTRTGVRAALALAVLSAACRDKNQTPAGKSATAAQPSVAVSSAVDAAVHDPVIDLLHSVACTVAVSSKVDNPADFPEHLVDGKADTAWNSKTDDLGGFIAFRVPKVARVLRVEVTAGFDKKEDARDLFTMNHRISRVRLSREGRLLKEVALDPDKRSLQAIDLDEPGGDFKLEVLATVPGTEKKWRELTVSEFRIWGRAGGAPENPSHLPAMAIGSLDGVRPHAPPSKGEPSPGPFATLEDLCREYDKVMTPIIDAAFPGDRYPGKISGPHCKLAQSKDLPELSAGAFKGGRFVTFDRAEDYASLLVLRTDQGFARTPVELWGHAHDDPGCLHASSQKLDVTKLLRTSTGQDVLVLRVIQRDIRWMQMDLGLDGVTTVERAYGCRVDDKGSVVCEGPLVTGRARAPLPADFRPDDERLYAIDSAKITWSYRKEPVLGPAGDLRVGP